ncbi:lipopolysaccharide biosynthesis protein [Rhodopirellula sallentina]|uniref:Spore cortex protein-putative membrane protein involved in the export of O-antigen and teichoic acid n=1 Tax=Rhodopirellula sallentina SM41 TaxID=1263870 RepID=M5TZP5_9BACT|nr:oligosaccharide flippase family protein [Rhodopirellula sallentina]EMI54677.1 spore cortex protein-putative membrane protein involved in the export of O-antigen and teichoic acid [Rhodopirellula sallentina SM41]
MSSAAEPQPMTPVTNSQRSSREFRVDSLAVGMVVMLAMTVVGRGIGFVRGMAFCRLMDDTDVGRWSMAFGFITLITPVMLFGIPGVLPKFTEHFRLKGQLRPFVRRIAIGTIACTGVFVAAMACFPGWFGWIIFLESQSTALIYSMAFAVVSMIVYNFSSDLNASLRQVRVVSLMQFVHGVGFTVLSLAWLVSGGDFTGLVTVFAVACLVASVPGFWSLARNWHAAANPGDESEASSTAASQSTSLSKMVRRLAPYAAALWMTNLIGNLFELSDRYMILHFLPLPPGASASGSADLIRETMGQAAVGQYHSGRIIPMMLLSVGTMIAGVLMPYLSADWEAKKLDSVRARVGDALLAVSLVFTIGGAFAIIIGPWMFDVLLQGRYRDGLALMPLALCFCTWSALVMVGQCYLLTAEKGRAVAFAMFVGLVANLALNAVLLPRFGLMGAVVATLLAHGVVMVCVWAAMMYFGYPVGARTVMLSLLPFTLLASPWVAVILAIAIGWSQWRNPESRERLLELIPARFRERLAEC